MRFFLALTLYRLLLPVLFVAAFPGWWRRMIQRGGLRTRLGERLAIYREPPDFEPSGAVHLHAVSVGETQLALKLIREWRIAEPGRRFVLATGTATGHAVGAAAALDGVRVTYAPLDFTCMVRRYLKRFQPRGIVLIEGEAWPNLLIQCHRRKIPVALANARMSPRSAARYARFAAWIRPLFGLLDAVAVQDAADIPVWENLGVDAAKIHCPGSLKIDPGSGSAPARRPDFSAILEQCGATGGRPVVLAASTHAGEEAWIAHAIRDADPRAFPVIVPRHAERRAEVASDLAREGFAPVLRSSFQPPADVAAACLVIDSTGELKDWTAHAGAVVIGKSFLATGGQNPCEAIMAGIPVICGPHMENFEPLATQLTRAGGCLRASGRADLARAIREALAPARAADLAAAAAAVLARHDGATRRLVAILDGHLSDVDSGPAAS